MSMSVRCPRDPDQKERLLQRNEYTSYRNFFRLDKSDDHPDFGIVYSKWVTLTKDEYYYFETTLKNEAGIQHQTIGVEMKPEVMPASHPLMETQILRFSLSQSGLKYDTMEIKVKKPDEGLFVLMFLNPTNSEWVKSGSIKAGCTADEMKAGIKGYYNSLFKVDPLVTLTYRDFNGELVEADSENMTELIYTVEVPIAINFPSVENIMTVPMTT